MRRSLSLAALVCALATPRTGACDSAAHTVGGVVALTGTLIVIGAVAIPIAACKSHTGYDSAGNTRTVNSCDDVSDGTKAAWIAGAGVGLTLAVLGGILYFETAPKQPRVALSPWVTNTAGGATFVARF